MAEKLNLDEAAKLQAVLTNFGEGTNTDFYIPVFNTLADTGFEGELGTKVEAFVEAGRAKAAKITEGSAMLASNLKTIINDLSDFDQQTIMNRAQELAEQTTKEVEVEEAKADW